MTISSMDDARHARFAGLALPGLRHPTDSRQCWPVGLLCDDLPVNRLTLPRSRAGSAAPRYQAWHWPNLPRPHRPRQGPRPGGDRHAATALEGDRPRSRDVAVPAVEHGDELALRLLIRGLRRLETESGGSRHAHRHHHRPANHRSPPAPRRTHGRHAAPPAPCARTVLAHRATRRRATIEKAGRGGGRKDAADDGQGQRRGDVRGVHADRGQRLQEELHADEAEDRRESV